MYQFRGTQIGQLDGITFGGEVNVQADGIDKREVSLPAGSEDVLIGVNLPADRLKVVGIQATGFGTATGTVTLKTNSASDPDDTIVLKAGEHLLWMGGSLCPITTDTTALYASVSKDETEPVTLTLAFLFDSTPNTAE